uniref:Uncharacterized protein n=1 Tax=Arundo donax TaxID=35708 RepID=A0A0A9HRC3_ARUDO
MVMCIPLDPVNR